MCPRAHCDQAQIIDYVLLKLAIHVCLLCPHRFRPKYIENSKNVPSCPLRPVTKYRLCFIETDIYVNLLCPHRHIPKYIENSKNVLSCPL